MVARLQKRSSGRPFIGRGTRIGTRSGMTLYETRRFLTQWSKRPRTTLMSSGTRRHLALAAP